METSTPILLSPVIGSARARLSGQGFGMTPLRKGRQSVAFQLDVSNDDIERAERRRSAAIRKSVSNLPPASATASPALNDSVRVLSEDDIKNHLQICSKLHAENKISTTNAWSLKIIDVLKQLVTKNNPDILNVAGGSLEIAGKVYGFRVDDLHAEGLKLATNLARNFEAALEKNNDENEENIDPNAPPENERRKKKQKKPRLFLSGDKKQTINRDAKSWRAKLQKIEPATFSTKTDTVSSAVGNLFTSKYKMDHSGYKFRFLSKEKAFLWSPGLDEAVKTDENKKFTVETEEVKSIENAMLSAPFSDFVVDQWDPDEENKELAKKASLSQRLEEEVVLDENGIPIPELDGSILDGLQDQGFDDVNDDDPLEEEVVLPHIHQEVEHIVSFRPTEQGLMSSNERSEYSYNTVISTCSGKIDQIWAGPSHWKLKFIRRSQPVFTGREKLSEQDSNKKKGQRKRNEPVHIDIDNLKPPIDLDHYSNKKVSKKKNHIMDESKITFPLFDSSCAELLANIQKLMTVPSMMPVTKDKSDVDYEVSGYNYDNPNDSRYVAPNAPDADNGADLGDDYFDNGDMDSPDSQEGGPFTDNNLIDAPELVPNSGIHYALRAKKMDMKKLKECVWCTLTHQKELDLQTKVVATTFSQLYKELPALLTEQMKQELSCHIVFVALLHLCNEQSLSLKQGTDFRDFQIFGPE